MDHNREPSGWDRECEADGTPSTASASTGWKLKTWVLLPLFLSYIVELIFTLWELDKQVMKDYFIFFDGWVYENGDRWDGRVSDSSFAYGFMETISRALIFVSVHRAVRYGVSVKIFWVCWLLEVVDGFDYWLFYNHTWFNTGIEFNYIKIGIILYFAWKEYTKSPK